MSPFRPPSRPVLLTVVTVVAAAVVAALVASAWLPTRPASTPTARPHTATPTFWVTSPTDPSRQLRTVPPSTGMPSVEVVLHPGVRRQTWWGTGAALTDASVRLLADRPAAQRMLYSPTAARGARLNLLRLPLSATDFSPRLWSWSSRHGRLRPGAPGRTAVEMVRSDLLPLRPDLRVIGASWSAPASMKTTGSLRGGALAEDRVGAYGELLVRQARWLADHGVPLWATSLGNEPGLSSDYPSMTMTDAQMIELGDDVGSRLERLGVRLWALDHNWQDRDRVDDVIGGSTGFDGAAFHCYGGEPGEMASLPVPRMVTECSGTDDDLSGTLAWDARSLVADAVAAGSSGLMMWNLALDPDHGPVDTGSIHGCRVCRGLVTVSDPEVVREPEFYTLAHLSRAALPGARVIDADAPEWLSVAAFRNPDGTVGVFGHNGSGTEQTVRIGIRQYVVRPGEMFTYRGPL